jgi:hypothetical protein
MRTGGAGLLRASRIPNSRNRSYSRAYCNQCCQRSAKYQRRNTSAR